jgi:hypothetical protein
VLPDVAAVFVEAGEAFAAGFKRAEAPTKTKAEAVTPPVSTFKMRGAVEP